MADLYETLGVGKDADQNAIKAGYRKAASANHPDREGGDEENFKRVKHAYEVLSDPARKQRYDECGAESFEPTLKEKAEEILLDLIMVMVEREQAGNLFDIVKADIRRGDKDAKAQLDKLDKLEASLKRRMTLAKWFGTAEGKKKTERWYNLMVRTIEAKREHPKMLRQLAAHMLELLEGVANDDYAAVKGPGHDEAMDALIYALGRGDKFR